ncbi:uncharacterized protein LOC141849338 isoform X2 [Brevipalpus obovatus]|uniref:uncharacterized protein LOC141849338 isoform X2 n=1 Tax=Brevipalpus obovatus TaxID=246614 RepID=UPI003D9E1261
MLDFETGQPANVNTASSMLSMLNMNMTDMSNGRQNPFHLLGHSAGPLSALHTMADLKPHPQHLHQPSSQHISQSSAISSSAPVITLPITSTTSPPNSSVTGPLIIQSPSSGIITSQSSCNRTSDSPMGHPKSCFNSAASPNSSSSSSPGASATPHGINDILSRPLAVNGPVTSTLGPSLAGALPRFSIGAAAVAGGMYFPSNGGLHKLAANQLYWNSLVQNQALWRERFAGGVNQNCSVEKDGKKKHTRPTFSGHQIYILEKTFEQQKYLAGPERAKLAFHLGMSESQVKVWFQNRRTKWRKKNAAEMATAKKRHDSEAESIRHQEDMSDDEDIVLSDHLSDKRLKKDHPHHPFLTQCPSLSQQS